VYIGDSRISNMGRIAPIPLEPGSATCDANWRIRVPANYAKYLQGESGPKSTVQLFVAALDVDELSVWSQGELLDWRTHLQQNLEENAVKLEALQFYGGETELDGSGRFVIPKNVRNGLKAIKPNSEIRILGESPLRFISTRLYEEKRKAIPLGPELSLSTRTEFSRYQKDKADRNAGR
jgi:DNA-binding transcriptional regulator/RsmH inhibitor MraZ